MNKTIALAGNPNVGKSTIFNNLTGMHQHTGNWPGKTVSNARGFCTTKNHSYLLVDLPGTYSLMAHSAEEEIARNFICFEKPDAVIVVCDATCLERSLNLVLQTMEITKRIIVCVNLMDEAKRKNICIQLSAISKQLGVPVVSTVAQSKKSLQTLLQALDNLTDDTFMPHPFQIQYDSIIEEAIGILEPALLGKLQGQLPARWLALRLLENNLSLTEEIKKLLGEDFFLQQEIYSALASSRKLLLQNDYNENILKDKIVTSLINASEDICSKAVTYQAKNCHDKDRKIDRFLTSKLTGYPIMLLLLALIFWLTINGANYPSAMLSSGFFWLQVKLSNIFMLLHAPVWLHDICILGIYRVLSWVVSVMLPPMAIFFPLFTLLEDIGYLPRIAFNLDKPFQRCSACGKQALTMCMGFGCNAAGVIGCRIIDSPRERLLAILTNNFVPCNGRFPTLIALIVMFFTGMAGGGFTSSILAACLLTAVILLGIAVTFIMTKLLSKTLLKGIPSSFTLELPPYRRPMLGKIILRSVLDRTLFVLGRAILVAAPAGMIIWLMANLTLGDISLLNHCALWLDPFAKLMGLDGVILIAFILGFPANEIVIPIIIMVYTAQGSLVDLGSLSTMKQLFVQHGWSLTTAACMMLFSLFHWPCSTTLLTIRKETGSLKWTALAAVLPTITGIILCMLVTFLTHLFTV